MILSFSEPRVQLLKFCPFCVASYFLNEGNYFKQKAARLVNINSKTKAAGTQSTSMTHMYETAEGHV